MKRPKPRQSAAAASGRTARGGGVRRRPLTQPEPEAGTLLADSARRLALWLRLGQGRGWLLGLLLVAGTVLAYQPIWHAGFVYDDESHVVRNRLLSEPGGWKRIWFSFDAPQYYPLVFTAFRLERLLWGLNPAGFHWVNLLLHTVNALLLWRLLHRLTIPGAWLAAALFALHPIEVESVAWISELKNVLYLCFYLLALLAWVEFVREQPKRLGRFYLLALVLYVLALLSKIVACTLPAALVLVVWVQGKKLDWRRWLQITPFAALGFGLGLLANWWEQHLGGAMGEHFSLGPLERLLVASRAIWFYAGNLLCPAHLTLIYPRWTINPAQPLSYTGLVAAGVVAWALYRARRRVGRRVVAAVVFYAAALSPALGFLMIASFRYSFVHDCFQYAAGLGLLALAAATISRSLERFEDQWPLLKPAACAALLVALGTLTWRHSTDFADAQTLWRRALAANPGCWVAHYNLGTLLLLGSHVPEAQAHLEQALELEPDDALAHNSLGSLLQAQGQVQAGITHFQKALELEPSLAAAHRNLGLALLQLGEVKSAAVHLRKALEMAPSIRNTSGDGSDLAQTHLALADLLLFQQGQADDAIVHYEKALALQPDFAEALNNLGCALLQKGRVREAIPHFQRAINTHPSFALAYNSLGWVLATNPDPSLRDGAKAIELARQADQLSGQANPVFGGTLAAAYAEAGRFAEAVVAAQRALQLAIAQTNAAAAAQLRTHLETYQTGFPLRDTSHIE